MKKYACLLTVTIMISILFIGSVSFSLDNGNYELPKGGNIGLSAVNYSVEDGIGTKSIADLTEYVRALSATRPYSAVEEEMSLLNISAEEYRNSAELNFGKRATIQEKVDYINTFIWNRVEKSTRKEKILRLS